MCKQFIEKCTLCYIFLYFYFKFKNFTIHILTFYFSCLLLTPITSHMCLFSREKNLLSSVVYNLSIFSYYTKIPHYGGWEHAENKIKYIGQFYFMLNVSSSNKHRHSWNICLHREFEIETIDFFRPGFKIKR